MFRLSSSRLIVFLPVLLLAAGLPILLFSSKAQKRLAVQRLIDVSDALARRVGDFHVARLNSAHDVLVTISRVPELRAGDWARTSEFLRELTAAHAHVREFSIVSADGTVLAGSRPSREPARPVARDWIAAAQRAGGFAVGGYGLDPADGRAYLPCALPGPEVPRTGPVFLEAMVDLGDLAVLGMDANEAAGVLRLVVDSRGLVLARSPRTSSADDPSGGLQNLVARMLGRTAGVSEVAVADGTLLVCSLARFSGPPGETGTVAVAAPRGLLYAEASRASLRNVVALVSGASLLFLVLIFALVTRRPRRILSPADPVAAASGTGAAPPASAPDPIALPPPVPVESSAEDGPAEAPPEIVRGVQHQTRAIALLNEMGGLLRQCTSVEEAYGVVGRFAQVFFPDLNGAVLVPCADPLRIAIATRWGESVSPPPPAGWAREACVSIRTGEMHRLLAAEPGPACDHLSDPRPSAYVCIPLKADQEILGVLHVACPVNGPGAQKGLPEFRVNLGRRLADHIALAIHNLKTRESLRTESIRDPLTGLFNRRHLEARLAEEVHRAARKQRPLGVILLDVDHFKKFNDQFGHDAGDAMLRAVAEFLRGQFRDSDVVCRYGGEEFVAILPEASPDQTLVRAEALLRLVRAVAVMIGTQNLGPVTLSVGVAAYPEHATTPASILKAADEALYRAKSEGRDCVRTAVPPAPATQG